MEYGLEAHPRGTTTKELLNYNITLKDPRNRIINAKARKTNLKYLLGEFIAALYTVKMQLLQDPLATFSTESGSYQPIIQDAKLHLIVNTFTEIAE